jgi:DNA-directed RNA polymerase specialized sigma subunit
MLLSPQTDTLTAAERLDLFAGLAGRIARRYEVFLPTGGTRDDLAQECRIALFRAAIRYDPSRGIHFSSYATAVVARAARRYLRDEARQGFRGLGKTARPNMVTCAVNDEGSLVSAVDLLPDCGRWPLRWPSARWQVILETLPRQMRQVVELRLFEGLSNRDIGREMGFEPSRVAHLWRRAIEHIRKRYQHYE